MKPTGVAQDEMFPDGDAGWMEMDEVMIFKLTELFADSMLGKFAL